MTPEENLLAAAEYISENGHIKGYFYPKKEDGSSFTTEEARAQKLPACAIGAIYITSGDRHGYVAFEAGQKLSRYLGQLVVPVWNDHKDTTAEDVILALKGAAHAESDPNRD